MAKGGSVVDIEIRFVKMVDFDRPDPVRGSPL